MTNIKTAPFGIGDRVMNTGNGNRKTIGLVTKVIDDEFCEVLWSSGPGALWSGTIRRDGSVEYSFLRGREEDRIVRVALSVRILPEN